MFDGEHKKDAIPVPVLTFVHWPFWPVKVYCPDRSPAGHPPRTNIVTQWFPEPPSTYMHRQLHCFLRRGKTDAERMTSIELVARAVAGDVVSDRAVTGVAAERGDTSVHAHRGQHGGHERECRR